MMIIKQCSCINASQDELHGKQKRAHNTNIKGLAVCTVYRRTDGVKGKMSVRKHPTRAKEYREGMNYYSH